MKTKDIYSTVLVYFSLFWKQTILFQLVIFILESLVFIFISVNENVFSHLVFVICQFSLTIVTLHTWHLFSVNRL